MPLTLVLSLFVSGTWIKSCSVSSFIKYTRCTASTMITFSLVLLLISLGPNFQNFPMIFSKDLPMSDDL